MVLPMGMMKKQTFKRVVASGIKNQLGFFVALNPDWRKVTNPARAPTRLPERSNPQPTLICQ
jgi:hypothetical protein